MKIASYKISPAILFFITIFGYVGYLASCTNDNQVITPVQPVNSATDLVSIKVTTPPTIDGTVDPMWSNSPVLEFSTAVPEVTGDVFRGYTDNSIPGVKLQSAYDAENVYFLAQWADPTQSFARLPWYFNPTTKLWAQEIATPTFSATGSITRPAFYEDKIAILWNINNSIKDWNSATCYKSCHTGLPATDGSSRHFTNNITERIDMWHWKSVRGGVNAGYQLHDQFQDNTYPNGRFGDTGGTDVYSNNTQSLPLTGGVGNVNVPKYVKTTANNSYWILDSEITAGTAKLVTGVDVNGVLTLSGGTTIDPAVGTDYQRIGNGLGSKVVAGVTLKDIGYAGTQGDITCKAVWADSKWTLEFKRKLTAPDAYDVDFASLADQYFGFAVFENAQIAHSIKPNLVLKFKK